jgi:O-acetylhomoserine (thiol)-lyase
MRTRTRTIHAAYRSDPTTRAVGVPLYQTASYLLKSTDQAADIYGKADAGDQYTYSRYGNPTNGIFEARMAVLEGGEAALAVASGMAAITYSILNLAQSGDNIVCSTDVYGSTRNLFAHTFARLGIEVRFVDSEYPDAFRQATDAKTRAYYGETLPNPSLRVFPFAEISSIAQELRIPLIVDNTAAPTLCRPFEHGANIVIHSATKYIGGHGTVIGGVVVDGGNFDWASSKRHPMLSEPDLSYHGVIWAEAGQHAAYVVKMRRTLLRDTGASLAPANALDFIHGLETLPLRMREHCQNALEVVRFLAAHPKVRSVNHPSLHAGAASSRARMYLHGGLGALIGVELNADLAKTKHFIESLEVFFHIVNIGDVRSLVTHPASTTHAQLSSEARLAAGVTDTYVRLSIGLEDPLDLIEDLEQAFARL